jgi:hypothetical protein
LAWLQATPHNATQIINPVAPDAKRRKDGQVILNIVIKYTPF